MKLPVLRYHKLHPTHRSADTVLVDEFDKQMLLLKERGYTTVTCEEVSSLLVKIKELPPQPLMITFDEGHISQCEYAPAILDELDFKATFFAPAEAMLKSTVREGDFKDTMNIEHLRYLHDKGFEVALQGYTNLDFSAGELNDVRHDIERSIALFKKLQFPITHALAYPGGLTPSFFWKKRKLYDLFRKNRITLAFNRSNKINNLPVIERFAVHRMDIKGTDNAKTFLKKINQGRFGWLV